MYTYITIFCRRKAWGTSVFNLFKACPNPPCHPSSSWCTWGLSSICSMANTFVPQAAFLPFGACTQNPVTDVKSMDPIHFLWKAGDSAAKCMIWHSNLTYKSLYVNLHNHLTRTWILDHKIQVKLLNQGSDAQIYIKILLLHGLFLASDVFRDILWCTV